MRDLGDGPSWSEFHAIYRPLIFGYLRSLGLKEHDANDLTQEVFWRLMAILPTFELDRRRGRFRTYLWRLTYTTLVDGARKKKVRDRAEEEWVRHFSEADESASRGSRSLWTCSTASGSWKSPCRGSGRAVSPTAWACFEARLVRRRPAAEIAAELGITANVGVRLCLAGPARGPAPLRRDRGGAGRWPRS